MDINGHVHHSVYLDYLLTARFDQMARCYKMSMEDFLKMGFTWITRNYQIEYRSDIVMGDTAVVRTWIAKLGKVSVDVAFQIESRAKSQDGGPWAGPVCAYRCPDEEAHPHPQERAGKIFHLKEEP